VAASFLARRVPCVGAAEGEEPRSIGKLQSSRSWPRDMAPVYRAESLLEALGRVRRAMLVRRSSARSGKRSARVTYQLEELEAEIAPLLPIVGVSG
jgi:hypothetical protein